MRAHFTCDKLICSAAGIAPCSPQKCPPEVKNLFFKEHAEKLTKAQNKVGHEGNVEEARKEADLLLCCYFAFVYLAEDVAFSKVDSLTFKRLVQALKKAPYDYRPPTRQKLSGEILDRNAESYAKEQHFRTEMPVCQGFKSHAAGFYCTSIVRQLYRTMYVNYTYV